MSGMLTFEFAMGVVDQARESELCKEWFKLDECVKEHVEGRSIKDVMILIQKRKHAWSLYMEILGSNIDAKRDWDDGESWWTRKFN